MTPAYFADLWSEDRDRQNQAYQAARSELMQPVSWIYDVWDEVVAHLSSRDNHERAIAGQVLCWLAIGDSEPRLPGAWDQLMQVTEDDKFVTARHTIQQLWRIGLNPDLRDFLLPKLAGKFSSCANHKNHTLIRHDLLDGLRKLADATGDERIAPLAAELIETEPDEKYRKKYAALWR